ncbi:hypothetical protein Acr_02g0000050 [Actinidia rufa]|uniref:Uncharacterized protein n=1 Tax=Actinidia rufa TaxID=165716 RepID=A0A7J0E5Z6_9ERIC|nr:hypothetical protein Acr_02g0000050 [Actinidia rufa]
MPKIYCYRPTIAFLPMTIALTPMIAFLLLVAPNHLLYRHIIPYRVDIVGQIRILALCIRDWVAQHHTTSSEELNEELKENTRIAQALNSNVQRSTPNTSSASSLGLSSSLGELEKGKEVKRGHLPILILLEALTPVPVAGVLVVSSGSEVVSDLSFPLVFPMVEDEIEHSFNLWWSKFRLFNSAKRHYTKEEGQGSCCQNSPNPFSSPRSSPNSPHCSSSSIRGPEFTLFPPPSKTQKEEPFEGYGQQDRIYKHSGELKKPRPWCINEYLIEASTDWGLLYKTGGRASLEGEDLNPPKPFSPILLMDFNEEEYANHPAEDGAEEGGVGDFEAVNKLWDEVGMGRAKGEDLDISFEM